MDDITYRRILLNDSKIKCVLMTKWCPDHAVNIHITTRESAWVGELSGSEVECWVDDNELDLQLFVEEMRGALGGEHKKSENLLYTLKSGTFSWKRVLSSGMTAILGQVEVKSVPVVDSYEAILDKSLDNLVSLQKQIIELRDENSSLIKDRDSAIARVTEFAELKEEWEKKLYGRFAALLNAKKEKIDALDLELVCLRNAGPEDRGERGEGAGTSSKGKRDGWRRGDEDSDVDTEEETNEATREDPYGADTDVDSDGSGDPAAASLPGPSSRSTPAASATLRRNRAMFDSFDSSGSPSSPAPVLPKRARMPAKASTSTSASTSGASGRNVFKDVVVQDQDEDDDDDMKPLTLDADDDDDEENVGENTQDLLDAM